MKKILTFLVKTCLTVLTLVVLTIPTIVSTVVIKTLNWKTALTIGILIPVQIILGAAFVTFVTILWK